MIRRSMEQIYYDEDKMKAIEATPLQEEIIRFLYRDRGQGTDKMLAYLRNIGAKVGQGKLYNALKELEDSGYVTHSQAGWKAV